MKTLSLIHQFCGAKAQIQGKYVALLYLPGELF